MQRRSSRTRLRASFACALAVSALVTASLPACSQGEGSGKVTGTLNLPNCWTGPFELTADFLAGVPFRETLQLRIQNGSDYQSFSDGISILLSDINKVRPNASAGFAGAYGKPLKVDIPPEVTPPGVPVVADPDPAIVSLALYMQKSCRTQNVTVYAMEEVQLIDDGTCDAPALMGADPATGCDPSKELPAGVGTGKSQIAFTYVFDGNVAEPQANERLSAGCFDVYLADPREVSPGGLGGPPRCRGHIRGTFSFYFERGRPSQPFP
ncbi:MAG: hypothetical protein JWP97_3118 [Labilithrix sp.]|nr:hypothetical protein [Labilithrix sp.]